MGVAAERPGDRRRASRCQGRCVRPSCRKRWEDKEGRAATVRQGKHYAERWCAARVVEGVPLKKAVAQLVATNEPGPKLPRTEIRQQRRPDAMPNPKM